MRKFRVIITICTLLLIIFFSTLSEGEVEIQERQAAVQPLDKVISYPDLSDKIVIYENVVFAKHGERELRVDLYIPSKPSDLVRPILLIHDLTHKGKEALAGLASLLASNGFGAVSVEYRTPFEHLYPAALEDVSAAVRWIRLNGKSYGLNTEAVGVAGYGFGGYIGALVGLSLSEEVQAVASIHTPMDLPNYRPPPSGYPYLHHIFLGFPLAQRPDLWNEASPVHQVHHNAPPFLLYHRTSDNRISLDQAEAMKKALDDVDAWVRLELVDDAGKDYFDAGIGLTRVAEDFTRFFDRFLHVQPAGIELQRDVVYASPDGRDVHLDLFRPKEFQGTLPAVVFIHGGGWMWGGKGDMWKEATEVAKQGFITASIEYRTAIKRIYPAAIDDAKAAVRWLRANEDELGIKRDRIGLVGSSAGGHIAALLGVTPHRKYIGELAGPEEPLAAVQSVVLISGVVDLVSLNQRDPYSPAAFLGVSLAQNPKLWAQASPINHIGPEAAAFLAIHGTKDELGSHKEMVDMAERLRSVGVRGEVFTIEGGQHDFWYHKEWQELGMQAMIKFLKDTLGKGM